MAEATHIATDEIGQRWHVTITERDVMFRGSPHVLVTVVEPGYEGIPADLYPEDALTPITPITTTT